MGIPRFFKWISESFPDTLAKDSDLAKLQKLLPNVDSLLIDANGIIHNCVKEVYFPEARVRFAPASKTAPKVEETNEKKKVFKNIVSYINNLYKIVKPKKIIFIAIDGTAPVAKQAQQRQRRYKSAETRNEAFDTNAITKNLNPTFDTNAITPGTEFMSELVDYINKNIIKKWKCRTVFSPPTEPGEGEHKLMEYVREKTMDTHVVYGLDADLFMLTLATHCKNIYLLREDMFSSSSFNTVYHVVKVHDISKKLYEQWGVNYSSQQNFINDFIFICFLVGNDFLHNIPSLWDLEASINMMLEILKNTTIQIVNFSKKLGISIESLSIFFSKIAAIEHKLLASQLNTKRYENKVLNSSMVNIYDKSKGIDLNTFRENYYKKAEVSDRNINEYCQSYIQGLAWVNWYYHNKPKNWRWIFPYHYSPLVTDLIKYVDIKPIHLDIQAPLTMNQQLLCVIPPKSKMLLPENLRKFYTDEKLKDFYPEKFEKDLSGKLKDWEAIALLPFVDIELIIELVK
jgi:5'-3' exonuclease